MCISVYHIMCVITVLFELGLASRLKVAFLQLFFKPYIP